MLFGRQALCPGDVVAVVGVPPVDHRVIGLQQRHERSSVESTIAAGSISHTARGLSSLATRSSSDAAPVAPSPATSLDHVGVHVVNDAAMPVTDEPPDQVGPHPAESNHAQLHGCASRHHVLLQSAA